MGQSLMRRPKAVVEGRSTLELLRGILYVDLHQDTDGVKSSAFGNISMHLDAHLMRIYRDLSSEAKQSCCGTRLYNSETHGCCLESGAQAHKYTSFKATTGVSLWHLQLLPSAKGHMPYPSWQSKLLHLVPVTKSFSEVLNLMTLLFLFNSYLFL